jgi:hypothetical protein
MRVLLSTMAVIANVLVLLLLLLGVVGQTLVPPRQKMETGAMIALAVVGGLTVLNLAAVLAGARAFKPKPPTSDVVATFN